MAKHTLQELKQWQALPLDIKIRMTETRIRGWINEYGEDGVYISFSGGKDSTVLMDIVRNRMGYNVPAVFVDVPTQYPELREFAKTWDNVEILRPKLSFMQVCEKYGFPLISKETSDCVAGAKKYLQSIEESDTIVRQTDRQTDRQTGKVSLLLRQTHREWEVQEADRRAITHRSRGGCDRKYRKLRGIGEFDGKGQVHEEWERSQISLNAGNVDARLPRSECG